MSRTPLKDRRLPAYTRGEDIANMVTHIIAARWRHCAGAGGAVSCPARRYVGRGRQQYIRRLHGGAVYGLQRLPRLRPGMGKKVLQVIDHCTIYFLIAGTYTPILLAGIRPLHPALAWSIFGVEWGLVAFAAVFTAIDHNRYKRLAMTCFIPK